MVPQKSLKTALVYCVLLPYILPLSLFSKKLVKLFDSSALYLLLYFNDDFSAVWEQAPLENLVVRVIIVGSRQDGRSSSSEY